MQKTIIATKKLTVDIDTINLKFGLFGIENRKICVFLGILQIYYYR